MHGVFGAQTEQQQQRYLPSRWRGVAGRDIYYTRRPYGKYRASLSIVFVFRFVVVQPSFLSSIPRTRHIKSLLIRTAYAQWDVRILRILSPPPPSGEHISRARPRVHRSVPKRFFLNGFFPYFYRFRYNNNNNNSFEYILHVSQWYAVTKKIYVYKNS